MLKSGKKKIVFITIAAVVIIFLLLPLIDGVVSSGGKRAAPQTATSNPLTNAIKALASILGIGKKNEAQQNPQQASASLTAEQRASLGKGNSVYSYFPDYDSAVENAKLYAGAEVRNIDGQWVVATSTDNADVYRNAEVRNVNGRWALVRQTAPEVTAAGIFDADMKGDPLSVLTGRRVSQALAGINGHIPLGQTPADKERLASATNGLYGLNAGVMTVGGIMDNAIRGSGSVNNSSGFSSANAGGQMPGGFGDISAVLQSAYDEMTNTVFFYDKEGKPISTEDHLANQKEEESERQQLQIEQNKKDLEAERLAQFGKWEQEGGGVTYFNKMEEWDKQQGNDSGSPAAGPLAFLAVPAIESEDTCPNPSDYNPGNSADDRKESLREILTAVMPTFAMMSEQEQARFLNQYENLKLPYSDTPLEPSFVYVLPSENATEENEEYKKFLEKANPACAEADAKCFWLFTNSGKPEVLTSQKEVTGGSGGKLADIDAYIKMMEEKGCPPIEGWLLVDNLKSMKDYNVTFVTTWNNALYTVNEGGFSPLNVAGVQEKDQIIKQDNYQQKTAQDLRNDTKYKYNKIYQKPSVGEKFNQVFFGS